MTKVELKRALLAYLLEVASYPGPTTLHMDGLVPFIEEDTTLREVVFEVTKKK